MIPVERCPNLKKETPRAALPLLGDEGNDDGVGVPRVRGALYS